MYFMFMKDSFEFVRHFCFAYKRTNEFKNDTNVDYGMYYAGYLSFF